MDSTDFHFGMLARLGLLPDEDEPRIVYKDEDELRSTFMDDHGST